MYYPSGENKGADQLCSYCTADLRLCFRIGKKQCGFRKGPIQTEQYKHRRRLDARNFGFRKYRNYTISVAKKRC